MSDKVTPIRIIDNENDTTYELDFSREAVKFAESKHFRLEDVADYPTTKLPELWYYAFRKNHRNIARSQTDAILEKVGGVTDKMVERLIQLYNQAVMSNNIIQDEEELAKNAKVTVEF